MNSMETPTPVPLNPVSDKARDKANNNTKNETNGKKTPGNISNDIIAGVAFFLIKLEKVPLVKFSFLSI